LESELMYGMRGEVADEEDYLIPLGKARVAREGKDVTIVAHQKSYWLALQAADQLEKEGYEAEVIDPRTIRPLDIQTIQESVRKTNRLVVVDESNPFASFSSEVTYQIQESVFDYLDAPVIRVTAKDVPAPYAKNLIEYYMPRTEEIIEAAKRVMYAD